MPGERNADGPVCRPEQPFGGWAETALDSGYFPIPCNGKIPAVGNWTKLGRPALTKIIKSGRYVSHNMGFRTGHLLAIDIDISDREQAYKFAESASDHLRKTPFVRVGRWPRRVLFYRLKKPMRSERIGEVDVLSQDKIVVVQGTHPDTGKPYYWPEETLLDANFKDVPLVDKEQVAAFMAWAHVESQNAGTAPLIRSGVAIDNHGRTDISRTSSLTPIHPPNFTDAIEVGNRNRTIFLEMLSVAGDVTKQEELEKWGLERNARLPQPLPEREIRASAGQVWKYKVSGNLRVPGKQSINLPLDKEKIRSLADYTPALHLYTWLKATREPKHFTIPQKATAQELGWSDKKIAKAIRRLMAEGLLRKVGPVPNRPRTRPLLLYSFR